MNKLSVWRKTLAGKAVCYVLCVLFIAVTVLSSVGCWAMYALDMYTVSERNFKDAFVSGEVSADGYSIMHHVAAGTNEVEDKYSRESTNLRYGIYDFEGKFVTGNIEGKANVNDSRWKYEDFYKIRKLSDDEIEIEQLGNASIGQFKNYYTFKSYVAQNTGVSDIYAAFDKLITFGYKMKYSGIFIGILSFVCAIGTFVNLMMVSGRRHDSDEVYETFVEKIPTDILICCYGILIFLGCYLVNVMFFSDEFWALVLSGIFVVMGVLLGLWICMSIAVRIKAGHIFTNTLIWKIIKMFYRVCRKSLEIVWGFIRKIPMIWKVLVGLVVFIAVDTFQVVCYWEFAELGLIIWVIELLLVSALVIYVAFMLIRLKKGGIALAKGDLNYTVDTSKMILDFKDHGENLNNIAVGMSKAVEDRMRSERMKTELITNVSHDIKNPLTSIISYAGLIASEECNCGKHEEYSKILVNKSEHLKRLLEDIVEISKATTGNLDVKLAPCRGDILLSQLVGEFEERCQKAGLDLVVNSYDGPADFLGDSRRIWRIFENMMSNICKYSLPGTRVYLDMFKEEDNLVFTFKNTSKEELNISADELMERFIRGDESRNTEGNGLGLSIAGSLMELQKGKMDILIDGDLFKVSLKFKGL